VGHLLDRGVAKSTLRTYNTGKKHYIAFCQEANISPLPAQEDVLCHFVAHLFSLGIRFCSVRSYLSAVRHLHIMSGFPDPSLTPCPRLEYVLRGFRRECTAIPKPQRLPITPLILRKIHEAWSGSPLSADKVMLWAAFCLGFFGFLSSLCFFFTHAIS